MTAVMKLAFWLIIAAAVEVDPTDAAKYLENKPDILNPCLLSDTKFITCFIKNLQVLFHEWKDGIPGYKALGSLDPLHIIHVGIEQDPTNPVALNADLRNVIVKGASKAVVKEAKFDVKSLNLQVKMFVPKLTFDCDYKLKGRILNLALNGDGKAVFEIENFGMFLNLQLKLRDEHGHTFTDIEKLNLDITDVGGFHVQFDNLFNGQKDLGDSMNSLINENWRDLFEILHPAISKSVEAIMYDRLSKAFSYVPANYFIKDIPQAAEHSG